MQRFIRVVMWLLFILALFILSAYLLPRRVKVTREKIIQAPAKTVFSQINDLHNWEKWSAWHIADPNLEIQFFNHGVGEDAGFIWNSEISKIGDGRLTIIRSVPYDSVICTLQFPERRDADCKFMLQKQGEEILLQWTFVFNRGFNPLARWTGLLTDKFFGPELEEGLDYLNTVCRVQVQENTPVVELVTIDSFYYASVHRKIYFENVAREMEKMFAEVNGFIDSAKVAPTGKPFAIYHEIKKDTIALECGIPVEEIPEVREKIQTGNFPSTQCAMTSFVGDYTFLEKAHNTIQNWIEKRRFKLAGPPMEKYINGPSENPTPDKWHTTIYYPVR